MSDSSGVSFGQTRRRGYCQTGTRGNGPRRFAELARALVAREFKGMYRRSILGPAWAFLQPLAYMVVFTFLRGVLDIPSEGVPYALFTFSALVPWTFFSNAISRCAPSVAANGSILKKISVPREVFPVAAVITSMIDLLIASVILAGMMLWFQTPVGWTLLWIPLLVLMTVFLALGMGLGLAAVGTYKHDVIYGIPFLMQFWLLASPVMYPASEVPEQWRSFFDLNPMAGIIEGFRNVLIRGTAPDTEMLLVSLTVTLLVWGLAWPLFRSVSQYFADVL
ncbi:MAG: ABC transporter permease [Magnetococcales bacterium]|nr:ABC transporter permease [Magnetococcales bacterium]MBF0156680.1 ABC transporter permease [Magnetococcales bacterium]